MFARALLATSLVAVLLLSAGSSSHALGCCAAGPRGKPVVNADQTVIMVWDPATKTQHFIRQASFLSEADDFGFLVPTPSLPELDESGNQAFPFLLKLTEPVTKKVRRPGGGLGCGCGSARHAAAPATAAAPDVRVVAEKLVAGFHAVVLEADTADVLIQWLKEHGYAYSPAVEAWAKPYVDAGWKITALKVAKEDASPEKNVAAGALRMTFKTDRPLFPYREPDSAESAKELGVRKRLLRIYFLADARYQGELTEESRWTGEVAWANRLSAKNRQQCLDLLKLPANSLPAECWLTEFEDNWPYAVAPADLYFARDRQQNTVEREPIEEYVMSPWPTDITFYAAVAIVTTPLVRQLRRRRSAASIR